MHHSDKPDLLLRIACAITGADASLVAECEGVLERRREIRHAAAFVLTFTVAALFWGAVLSLMLPLWAAILGGILAGAIIYLLDLSISTADWELKGILAEPMTASFRAFTRTLARWVKVAIRVGLALILATVTGTYATLWVFNESVESHLHAERQAYNAPIEAAYRAATERLRTELLAGPIADRKAAVDERGDLQQRLRDSQSALVLAEQAATDARLEMHREETGVGGRAAGRGPKFREAELRFEAANRRLDQAQQNLDGDRARLVEIESRITAIDGRVREADSTFQVRATALAEERDAKLRPAKSDFLMRFQALNQMKEHSLEVTFVSYATKAVIVIVEMIFFLVFLNAHASTYMVRLIARTRLEAARVDGEFGRALRQINDQYGGASSAPVADPVGPIPPGPSAERLHTAEGPLFEPAPEPADPAAAADPWLAGAPAPNAATERHPVIGGEPGEVVTTAEALADPDRYWVNPDRPDEIWNRRHRDGLLDPGYGKAA
jgi:hypothetical protein